MEEQKKKGLEIRIGGRTIPMLLTTWEVIQIQEEIGCTVPQMWDQVFGIEHIMEDDGDKTVFHVVENKDMMRKLGMLIRICGNAGLEEAGHEPDLKDKWILRNMKPGMILPYTIVAMSVVNDAMRQEVTDKEKKDGPVDEILEEENRKKEPGSLRTGESAPMGSSPD